MTNTPNEQNDPSKIPAAVDPSPILSLYTSPDPRFLSASQARAFKMAQKRAVKSLKIASVVLLVAVVIVVCGISLDRDLRQYILVWVGPFLHGTIAIGLWICAEMLERNQLKAMFAARIGIICFVSWIVFNFVATWWISGKLGSPSFCFGVPIFLLLFLMAWMAMDRVKWTFTQADQKIRSTKSS